jgi:hypothetical protein
MSRDLRTVLGFLIIFSGIIGGLWLGWWFIFRGDIIEILHRVKMGLPGWGWWALKVGISAAFGGLFLLVFIALGMKVLGGDR